MRRIVPFLFLALTLPCAQLVAGAVTLTPAADTTIFQENGDASDAKGQNLFAGGNTLGNFRRAFVRFDVAGTIPAGSTINGARLDLALNRAKGNPVDVYLFAAAAAWGEGTSASVDPGGGGAPATPGDATWTMRVYPGTAWLSPGGDTAASPSARSPIDVTLGTWSWGPTAAMTSDVQSWLDNPATNFGWQIRADELQAPPSARRFGSRESATPPVLTITYTPPGGGGPGPRSADDVPALSPRMILALAAALGTVGALVLKARN
jgi:hypothetical protein